MIPIKNKLIIIFILIGLLITIICIESLKLSKEEHPFEKGKIEVYFKSNVSFEEAIIIVETFNCSILENHGRGNYSNILWVEIKVPIGEEKKYVEIFKKHSSVYNANLIIPK